MPMGKKESRLYDFKFGTFIGRFQSDGAARMAVEGLKKKKKKKEREREKREY